MFTVEMHDRQLWFPIRGGLSEHQGEGGLSFLRDTTSLLHDCYKLEASGGAWITNNLFIETNKFKSDSLAYAQNVISSTSLFFS